jgi:hypothetical protein
VVTVSGSGFDTVPSRMSPRSTLVAHRFKRPHQQLCRSLSQAQRHRGATIEPF